LVVYLTRTIEDTEAAIEQIEKLSDQWLGGYNSDIRSQIYVRYDYYSREQGAGNREQGGKDLTV